MKRIITLALTLAALLALTVTACADTIPGTAKLTITPTDTTVSGDTATVTYSVTVTPPEGKELGVFSVQLQPSEGMTLAREWEDSSGNRLIDYVDDLTFNKYQPNGVFAIYSYTAETGYFAAAGTTAERRMSQEATILTIRATMPANKSGTYTLNAEFIAALDGSGDVYTAQVITTPVTVSDGKAPVADTTPVITETDADSIPGVPNGSGAVPNDTAQDTDASGGDTASPDGAAPDAAPGGTDAPAEAAASAGLSSIVWIILAAVLIAAVVIVIVVKKKKQ